MIKNVYFSDNISPEGLVKLYDAVLFSEGPEIMPSGKVGVKLSTGEHKSNYLRPQLIKDLVNLVDGTIVECNTYYEGPRHQSDTHYELAKSHGFTDIASFDIQDSLGEIILPVKDGKNIQRNIVGKTFLDYDYYLVLSHFKGHQMAGFGGAIKNISIGMASSRGKHNIHTAGQGGDIMTFPQIPFLESMAEAAKSIVDSMRGRLLYINILNRISIDCDCNFNPAEPEIADIGIAASFDPVALDTFCIDRISDAEGNKSLMDRIEEKQGTHLLDYAQEIGLGNKQYNLVDIDVSDF